MGKANNNLKIIICILTCLSFLAIPACAKPSPSVGLFLTISEPNDGSIVNSESLMVKGKTSAGAVASVNGEVAVVDDKGNFSGTVLLEKGANLIEIIASDAEGNEESLLLTVFRE